MTWHGDEIRHSLVRQGISIKRNPVNTISDVRGLEALIKRAQAGEVGQVALQYHTIFNDWEIVVDSKPLGEQHTKEQLASLPGHILAFNYDAHIRDDVAYAFVGKGGAFKHPKGYKDNQYMEPVGYSGAAIIFEQPVTLWVPALRERGELMRYLVKGLVGIQNEIAL